MEKLYILKTGKGLQNNIATSDIELIREEVDIPQVSSLFFSGTTNKTLEISFTNGSTIVSNAFTDLDTKVTAVSVTGTTTKTLTITNSDASTVSTTFTDETGSGSVVVDSTLSDSSTNPLENQAIESALDAVSVNVSSQIKYLMPGKAIQFTIHPTILTTDDATAVPYGDDLIFVSGNADRYLLIRTTNTANPVFINNFFGVTGRKVLVRTQRNTAVPSEPLLNYEERLSYAVFSTTPSTELSNVDPEYTEYKLDPVLGNFQVGIGQVTLAQGAFVNMGFYNSIIQETGTFTPTFTTNNGSGTYIFDTALAQYSINGNHCNLTITITQPAMTSAPTANNAGLILGGFPANIIPNSGYSQAVIIGKFDNTTNVSPNNIFGFISSGLGQIDLRSYDNPGSVNNSIQFSSTQTVGEVLIVTCSYTLS